ncbi:peptidylprolyl isomerase [Bizionia sediminis]|uniref:Peptidylprolyl isomerase n=1 Tax=Bizionia sediminis TaxID=1737064 RepID=A0ABW5KPN8_9FLAO
MNKLFILLFCVHLGMSAQNNTSPDFKDVKTPEDAASYLQANPSNKNQLIVFNKDNHQSDLAKKLFSTGLATVDGQFEKTHYKVVSRYKTTNYRASYIFIDGHKMSEQAAEDLIKEITKKYKSGIPFTSLAHQYSMDRNGNRNGDTGWFAPGTFNPDLEKVIMNVPRSQRDLFAFELKEKSWYYLVLNSYKPKEVKEIKVLKIVEKK